MLLFLLQFHQISIQLNILEINVIYNIFSFFLNNLQIIDENWLRESLKQKKFFFVNDIIFFYAKF